MTRKTTTVMLENAQCLGGTAHTIEKALGEVPGVLRAYPRATEDTHMADLPPYAGSNSNNGNTSDDTSVGPDRESRPSTPRWVKVFGIIVIVLVLLFVILHLAGGGFGPTHRS